VDVPDPLVSQGFDRPARTPFRTVVDDDDFESDAALCLDTRNRFEEEILTPKRGDNHTDLDVAHVGTVQHAREPWKGHVALF
jgi:hypothetical protein